MDQLQRIPISSGNNPENLKIKFFKSVEKTTKGPVGVDAGGQAGDDADSDDEGKTGRCGEEWGMG